MSKVTVACTGITGYLGCWILHELLSSATPQYYVHAVVRSTQRAEPMLASLKPAQRERVTLFEVADIASGNFEEAFQGRKSIFFFPNEYLL